MFRLQRHHSQSNDDSDQGFNESVQRDSQFPLARSQSFISKEIPDTNSYVALKNPTLAQ